MKLLRITIELEDSEGNTLKLTDGTVRRLDRSLHYLPSDNTEKFDGRRFDDLVYVGRRIVRAAEAIVRAEDAQERRPYRPYNAIDIISRAEPSDGIGLGGRVVKERPKKAPEDDDIDGCPI